MVYLLIEFVLKDFIMVKLDLGVQIWDRLNIILFLLYLLLRHKPGSGRDGYLKSTKDLRPFSLPIQSEHNTNIMMEVYPEDHKYEIDKPYCGSKYLTTSQSIVIQKALNKTENNIS